ncbi:hypothetical protein FKM82_029900 [Ascaphus truei]
MLGKDSLRGPPQAEQELDTGVLTRVQRGQLQPDAAEKGRAGAPTGSGSWLGGTGSSRGDRGRPLGTGTAGRKPHSWQPVAGGEALVGVRLVKVQRLQVQRCSAELRRRMWLRSGWWRGASQMVQ